MPSNNYLNEADIAIIGAGIMGSSIAFQISRSSDKKVILIDQYPPVGGMSGRTFGQIRQHYSNEILVKLSIRGFEVLRNWQQEVGVGDPGYARMGYLLLVVEKQLAALQRNINLGQQSGVDTRFVVGHEISAIEPLLSTDDLAGGAYEVNGGFIDVTKMVLSWLTAAQQFGVQFHPGVTVQDIHTSDNKVTGLETDQGFVKADTVINATGAWGRDLLLPLGIEVPIERRRLDMAYMRLPNNVAQLGCCITDGNSNVVIRPDLGRDFLAVAYAPTIPIVDDPFSPASKQEINEHHDRIRAALSERLPALTGSTVTRDISGSYDVTPDYHPILGWSPVDGLYLAMGFSGHGLKLAPAIGEVVADNVLGKSSAFDIDPLRLSRFAENDLMYLAYGPNSARA
ncbi:MAG: sarcosine oxidase subunit beta [Parasphingorhabdus sp.]|jgi:sarcosine oxidase subunit beta